MPSGFKMTRPRGHLLAFVLVIAGLAVGAIENARAQAIETLVDELNHPWALAFLPDGNALVTERSGQLLRLELNSGQVTEVPGAPAVDARGQGGLLDIELHPNFASNRWVYLTWARACDAGNATHLGRGRLVDNRLTDFETLFVATPCVRSTKHYGSRIVFDRDGYLWMTTGDRGERDRAQDLGDHNGSVIRLHDDGRIPADNPFVGRDDALDAIYSFGHRNPQGAAIHPDTGALWIHEHGPRGGDEINLPVAGGNFGWPETTYGREYWGPSIGPESLPGTIQPIYQWTPSIAPSGMAFFDGDLYVGALVQVHLAKLTVDGQTITSERRLLADRGRRIRAVEPGPDGALYLLTDHERGELIRLRVD